MNKAVWVLFAILPLLAPAQSVITIAPQHCVWRAGDDPSWAAPALDESGWHTDLQWKITPEQAHIWVRCGADLSSLRTAAHPAIQITLDAAHELFLNGQAIGGAGNVRTGVFSMNVIRQFPVNTAALGQMPWTVALRITYRFHGPNNLGPTMDFPKIRAGDLDALNAERAAVVLAETSKLLINTSCYFLIGVVGLMLLGLYYYDRSHSELLYLSILCLTMAMLRVSAFCAAAQADYSSTINLVVASAGNITASFATVLFFFALARRRMPRFYWVPLAIITLQYFCQWITLFFPADQAFVIYRLIRDASLRTNLSLISFLAIAAAPFVAFWPYTGIARRPLAALCLLWGVAELVWFIVQFTNNPLLGLPNFFAVWRIEMLDVRAFVTTCVLVALLWLLFRDQRQVTQERALLAGEMQAASQIQRMLAPAALDCAPGLQIEVAFRPMRDVGGDFYLCCVLKDGRQRILLGDVSGKGSAAAMTATLLLGAGAERDADSPADLLAHLNKVLLRTGVGGLATCLCADFAPDGHVTLANAGHLAPYLRGEELPIHPGLPLGINTQTTNGYQQLSFTLAHSDTLTLISDGVVEARSSTGDLFGFDRTRAISNQTADQIAHTAQQFGQADDITVMTLTRLKPGEQSDPVLAMPALAPA